MATSSSLAKNYDVFLSFRGKDTRKTIVSCLYEFMCLRGLFTFKDDERLELGDDITGELRKAIKTSWFAVVVISQNYATSSWCLEELRLIMDLHKENQIEVVPIFYGVEPTVVRHRSGGFESALQSHRNNASEMKMEKVKRWEEALSLISGLSGQDSTTCVDDAEMITTVVESISTRLRIMKPTVDLMNMVGMKTHMNHIDPLLDFKSENECLMLGIWGMGGIGKTTIAKCLYARFSQQFPAHCFLENICQIFNHRRPQDLQRELLSHLTHDDNIKLWSVEAGCQEIKSRLRHKKVFVVLDGVDRVEQLRALAQETTWFGPGSRIIITTRDMGLLNSCKVNRVYKVKCLEHKDALHIFKQSAFGAGIPVSEGFEHLTVRGSRLAHGLPSALVAFGLHLSQNTTIQDWENELEILETSPHEDVQKIFMSSYDGLDQRDKSVFLHVACLFNKGYFRQVITFFDNGDSRIKRLAAKSLINISTDGWIDMHFLVVQAGREIVCCESESDPSAKRILWDLNEICDVLENNTGSDKIEGLALQMCKINVRLPMTLRDNAFSPMNNLKFLKFIQQVGDTESKLQLISDGYGRSCKLKLLHWDGYPRESFPSTFRIDTLVELNLRDSNLLSLWNDTRRLDSLRRIDVRGSTNLKELPDLATAVNLEELVVEGCRRLVELPHLPTTCKYLRKLNMVNCDRLRSILNVAVRQERNRRGIQQIILTFLDTMVTLSSLTDLSIQGQISIDLLGLNGKAEHLSFSLVQIPHEQIGVVTHPLVLDSCGLESINIKWFNYSMSHSFSCRSFSNLPYLTELKLINLNIQEIPDDINQMQLLKTLDLSGNDFEYLPTTMGQLAKLKYLSLHSCSNLKALPQLTQVETLILSHCENLRSMLEIRGVEQAPSVYRLLKLCLDNCKGLDSLSDELSHFNNLEYLDLSSHEFETILENIEDFLNLRTLWLNKCRNLMVLEGLPDSLEYLYAHGCESLLHLSLSSNHSIKHLDLSHCFKLDNQIDLIIPFLYDKHSHRVTPSLVCVPESREPIFCYYEAHDRYRGINPPYPNNHKLLGFAFLFEILSMNPLHLQFPAFTFSWQWTSDLLGTPYRELMINLKTNIYIPPEINEENDDISCHLLVIHIPNSINNEEDYNSDVQFRAYLQHPQEFQVPPPPEILFCQARKIFENCHWEQPLEDVTFL